MVLTLFKVDELPINVCPVMQKTLLPLYTLESRMSESRAGHVLTILNRSPLKLDLPTHASGLRDLQAGSSASCRGNEENHDVFGL